MSVTDRLQRDLLTETASLVKLKPYEFTQTSVLGSGNAVTSRERLYNFKNVQFLGHLYVGTPPQEFIVIYDTGSSLLWVTGQCSDGGCQHHNHFDPEKSSSFVAARSEPTEEYIQYGTGSCVLELGRDTVLLGDLEVEDQPFGFSSQESLHPFVDVPTDGLVGMVLDDGLVENIKKQGKLKRNIFAIYFSSDPSEMGSISWGSVDPRFVESPIYEPVWIQLINDDYWRVKIEGLKVGEKYVPLCGIQSDVMDDELTSIHHPRSFLKKEAVSDLPFDSRPRGGSADGLDDASEPDDTESDEPTRRTFRRQEVSDDLDRELVGTASDCTAAIDTGSSLITVPSEYLRPLREAFADLGFDVDSIDCTNKHAYPTMGIVMRSVEGELVEFDLTPDDYVVEANEVGEDKPQECMFGIMPMDVPPPRGPLMVLGVTFLQRYYTIFDFENHAVGFTTAVLRS